MDQDSEEPTVPKKENNVLFKMPETEWSDFYKHAYIKKTLKKGNRMEEVLTAKN